jgi:hypothetical protein
MFASWVQGKWEEEKGKRRREEGEAEASKG